MNEIVIKPVGTISAHQGQFTIQLDRQYSQTLVGLNGFSHILVLWWSHLLDRSDLRSQTILTKPYQKGPDRLGIYATRSPMRPNPICVSIAPIISVDEQSGRVVLAYIDAEDGTPVLDIKPYLPCADRVMDVSTPSWNSHWPTCYEDSGNFNWEDEFSSVS